MLVKFIIIFAIGAVAGVGLSMLRPAGSEIMSRSILHDGPVAEGCILVASRALATDSHGEFLDQDRVFLVNRRKEIVHAWRMNSPPYNAQLDSQGALWALIGYPNSASSMRAYTLDGRLEKELKIAGAHHDFAFVGDDRILILNREAYKGKDLPAHYLKIGKNWKVDFIELRDLKSGEILRRFDLHELIDFSAPLEFRFEMSLNSINSVVYVESNPINHKPALLVSARFASTVAFIDFESGQIIWRSRKGAFSKQHNANLLSNGDLLIFNNGGDSGFSSVIQYDPKRQEQVWEYRGNNRDDFYVPFEGGAQRLANGNTLITWSSAGYVFEVDPEGRKVWEWFNTTMPAQSRDSLPFARIFRATFYAPDAPEIAKWKKACS